MWFVSVHATLHHFHCEPFTEFIIMSVVFLLTTFGTYIMGWVRRHSIIQLLASFNIWSHFLGFCALDLIARLQDIYFHESWAWALLGCFVGTFVVALVVLLVQKSLHMCLHHDGSHNGELATPRGSPRNLGIVASESSDADAETWEEEAEELQDDVIAFAASGS